jgi:hypothetical protein
VPDRWFEAAAATADGIFVPGHGKGTIDFLLGSAGATLSTDVLDLHLPWDEPGRSESERWHLSSWRNLLGIALGIHRGPETEAVWRATVILRDRLNLYGGTHRGLILLCRVAWGYANSAEVSTVAVLVELLQLRPTVQGALADIDRVRRLVVDIADHPYYGVVRGGGLRTTTMEILVAMGSLHYVHELRGRPLPTDVLPAREEAIDAVEKVLRANPQASEASRDRTRIGEVLDKHYLGVEPWPFEALF